MRAPLSGLFVTVLLLLSSACSHAVTVHPCAGGNPRERRAGETVLRQRDDARRALVFVQSVIGAPATMDVFWPERAANDEVFVDYDVYVLAARQLKPAECVSPPATVSAIAGLLDSRVAQYPTVVIVATDGRDAIAIDEALSSLSQETRNRVKEVFLFNTPAADALLRSLPQSCAGAPDSAGAREDNDRTICSTFDRKRLADVPVVSRACDQVVIAAMPPEIEAAPPCDDALYPIFRAGLAGTVYEREHVLPRFGETR